MFGILDQYIGKMIFKKIIMTLLMLTSLSGIIKFVDQLRSIGEGSYTAFSAGIFTLLSGPKDTELFLPMAVLLGAMLGLGHLATRSELVVMEASGFTRMQIAGSVMKTAIPLVLLTIAISEWLVPHCDKIAHDFRAQKLYGGLLLSPKSGFWAKDGNDFIYIEDLSGEKILTGLNIYHFSDQNRLESVRCAATAIFVSGVWRLSRVNTVNLTNEQEVTGAQESSGEWLTNLTPEKLHLLALDATSLPIIGLYNYVKYLRENGQEGRRYQLHMWNKILSPLSVIVMILMAVSFIFGPLRSVSIGVCLVTGVGLGFLFYIFDQIFGQLSLVYNIHPALGALLPIVIFFLISVHMLLKFR